MKGRLKSCLLSIAIALCCGVMAFGVYSAVLSASLTANGTLGFTAHASVGANVTVVVDNIAEKNTSTNSYVKTSKTLNVAINASTTTTESLGNLYFYNGVDENGVAKVLDMTFTVTIENTEDKALTVKINNPTGLATNVKVSTAEEYASLPYSANLDANGSTTITFAFTYSGTSAFSLTPFNINMEFTAS